jgi:hypothetical protein
MISYPPYSFKYAGDQKRGTEKDVRGVREEVKEKGKSTRRMHLEEENSGHSGNSSHEADITLASSTSKLSRGGSGG